MQYNNKIEIGNFVYFQNEKGEWLHKANDTKVLKKDGTLKAQYKDLPRYDIVYELEDDIKKDYKKTINTIAEEIVNKLLNI